MELQLTSFARHYPALETLEGILQNEVSERNEALLIGPGLMDFATIVDYEPELIGLYSWEPFELALVLERIGKPWRLTVADRSDYILNAVKKQTTLPVHFDRDREGVRKAAYTRRIVAQMEAMGAEINTNFSHPPASYIGTAEIPERIKSRMEATKRNLSKPEQWEDLHGRFNIVMCHFVIDADPESETDVLPALLAPNGILSYSGHPTFPGLNPTQDKYWGFYRKEPVHTAADARALGK